MVKNDIIFFLLPENENQNVERMIVVVASTPHLVVNFPADGFLVGRSEWSMKQFPKEIESQLSICVGIHSAAA